MIHDYSVLLKNNPDYFPSWEQYYDLSLTYPQNLEHFFRKTVPLPYDFYKVITVYALIPSALAQRVPYLFFFGVSGSGKSTLGKIIAYIHGITITSSETTYAAIRNSLRERKSKILLVENEDPKFPCYGKEVEANTFMVWEDIDDRTFIKHPQIYNMFKFGCDKACDTIQMSSEIKGKNETFRCFSPKVFSSIHPIHTIEQFKELRRRLIVIPTKKLEFIEQELLDIDQIDWSGFSHKFNEFWDLKRAKVWLMTRSSLRNVKGLTSTEKAISLDLIATGIAAGIWSDETVAVQDLKDCFNWLKKDVEVTQSPLRALLEDFIKELEKNAGDTTPFIYAQQLKAYWMCWYEKSWLIEKPTNRDVAKLMNEFGYRTNKRGQWIKHHE